MQVDKIDWVQAFDQTKTKPNWVSAVTQYKEVSIWVKLGKGKYVIVPSTSQPGLKGKFILSIYSDCNENTFDLYHMKGEKKDWMSSVNQYNKIEEEEEDEEVDMNKYEIVKSRLQSVIIHHHDQSLSES